MIIEQKRYAVTPYMIRVVEHQVHCAAILHSMIPKTWELGEIWCVLALQFSGEEVTVILPPDKLPSQMDDKIEIFRTQVKKAVEDNLSLVPKPTADFPAEFTISFRISPTGSIVPIDSSIRLGLSLAVSHIASEIMRNERRRKILGKFKTDEFGIYQLTVDTIQQVAACETKKSIGASEIDKKIMHLIEKYCFSTNPKKDRWPPERTLAKKYQIAISFARNQLSAIGIESAHVLSLTPELYSKLPKPLPKPPADLGEREARLKELGIHCDANLDDLDSHVKYAIYLVDYAASARRNPTAKIDWQRAANLSIEICRSITSKFPDSPKAHRELAYCLGRYSEIFGTIEDNIHEIRQEYRKAADLGIEDSLYGNQHLANLYVSIGRYKEAVEELESLPNRTKYEAFYQASLLADANEYSQALSKLQKYERLCSEGDSWPNPKIHVEKLRERILAGLNTTQ